MKPVKKLFPLFVIALLIVLSLPGQAQKAVLYNYDFRVPDAFRHEIQNYDQYGRKKYITDSYGNTVLDKYFEPISKEEVQAICNSAAEFFKSKYGYTEVTMLYPTMGGSQGDKISDFPNKAFKATVKKNPADAYITMEFKIQNKAIDKSGSLAFEESGSERTIFMGNVTLSYTIFNAQEGILHQKEISLKEELDPIFNENYNTEIVDSGFKVRKLYLSKEEIMAVYKLAGEKLKAAE